MSVIFALDDFTFHYLPCRTWNKSQVQLLKVKEGEMIAFTHRILHSGGLNPCSTDSIRLFAHLATIESDIVKNFVQIYNWDKDGFVKELNHPVSKPRERALARLSRQCKFAF